MSNKKNVLASIIISLIIGVILGTLLVVLAGILDFTDLLKWGLIIIGIITIISNIPSLVNGILNITKASGIIDLIFSILGIVLGCMMIFMQGTVVTVIVAVYLIAFPIVRIILAGKNGWKDQIKKEWVKILIGVLLLAFLPALMNAANDAFEIILLVAGWVVIGLSVLLFVLSLISYIKASKKADEAAPIEASAEETQAE
ncbi:MAG: hypothetical protein IJY39_08955 [Clostridia bacterium]|nr:hypothetical protein [Clostridia bacterium]